MMGARERSRAEARERTPIPGISAGGIRPSAKPCSKCLSSDEKPCGETAGPRLKRAPGPRQWTNQFRGLIGCAGAGFEPAPDDYNSSALPLSYPRLWIRLDSNQCLRV